MLTDDWRQRLIGAVCGDLRVLLAYRSRASHDQDVWTVTGPNPKRSLNVYVRDGQLCVYPRHLVAAVIKIDLARPDSLEKAAHVIGGLAHGTLSTAAAWAALAEPEAAATGPP